MVYRGGCPPGSLQVNHVGAQQLKKLKLNFSFFIGRQTNTADEPILLQVYEALLNHRSFKESLDSLNHLVETLSPHSRTPEKQFLI